MVRGISNLIFGKSVGLATFILAVILITPQKVSAADKADEFIKDVGQRAIASLQQADLSSAEREAQFRRIFNESFDVKLLARFSLGIYWRRSTRSQQQEYLRLFENFVVKAYATRFSGYSGEKFKVGTIRDLKGGDKLVASEIILKDGRTVPVHWRVRDKKGHLIVDVLVEGISMAITQRDEFSSIISQNGGRVDGLLIALRNRTQK